MSNGDSFVQTLEGQLQAARRSLKKLQPEYDHRKQLMDKALAQFDEASLRVAASGYVFATSRDKYTRSRRLNSRAIDSMKYDFDSGQKSDIASARKFIKATKSLQREAYISASLAQANLRRCRWQLLRARESFQEIESSYNAALSRVESISITLNSRLERLEELKRRNREIAFKAGVASQFLDEVLVKHDRELGLYNIYFGGEGRPDGPGHGHYTVADDLHAHFYRREPGAKRGGNNFINSYVDVRRRFLISGSTKSIDNESA